MQPPRPQPGRPYTGVLAAQVAAKACCCDMQVRPPTKHFGCGAYPSQMLNTSVASCTFARHGGAEPGNGTGAQCCLSVASPLVSCTPLAKALTAPSMVALQEHVSGRPGRVAAVPAGSGIASGAAAATPSVPYWLPPVWLGNLSMSHSASHRCLVGNIVVNLPIVQCSGKNRGSR